MYTLRSIAKRGLILTAGLALVAATFIPPMSASADSLNPLTERSLTLSSSSPGWSNTDGSGNSTYAPPNSGANGEKTGNYFSFKVSTDTSSGSDKVKAISFQYCTTSAGKCTSPGNNATHGPTPTATTADLNVNYTSAAEVSDGADGAGTITTTTGTKTVTGTSTTFGTDVRAGSHLVTAGGDYTVASIESPTSLTLTANVGSGEAAATYKIYNVVDPNSGNVIAVPGYTNHNPKYQSQQSGTGDPQEAAKNVSGNYVVMYKSGSSWVQSTGWTVTTANQEDGSSPTGQQNTIVLNNATGLGIASGTEMKVLFFATGTDYITNPGAGAFFVKINTYKAFTPLDDTPGSEVTLADNATDVIDGGVTVANVMNQSIQITTKVLETMQFSVGTVDPNTLSSVRGADPMSPFEEAQYSVAPATAKTHGTCDPILTAQKLGDPENVLPLGNQDAESSLEVANAYATHSYWRLSSNSSAGATVYYSGHTLSNTVGDEIRPIGPSAQGSVPGSEQFGLAIANGDGSDVNTSTNTGHLVDYSQVATYENGADNGLTVIDPSVATDVGSNPSYHTPQLYPLAPTAQYTGGTVDGDGLPSTYAFDPDSDTVPVAIAEESSQVVDCVTAKMRYIANIAATTPAGIYTTKINYIAAPQY